jgi:hypothetical protein
MLSRPPKVSISLFVLNLPHRLVAAGMVNIDLLPLLAQLYLMVGKQLELLWVNVQAPPCHRRFITSITFHLEVT